MNYFLTNYTKITFLDKIKESLSTCSSFMFSVSFIKKAGLKLLYNSIERALERGAEGKLITSTYQNFTDILSLNDFLELQNKYPNFKCHLDYESFSDAGFHSKGYLFSFKDSYELIIGSSNITRYALLKNIEWNLSIQYSHNSDEYNLAFLEFLKMWEKTELLDSIMISRYATQLEYAIEKWDMDDNDIPRAVNPNFMQRKALKEIKRYRDLGCLRSLVVAATASGKTYLSAFDARNFGAKKLLFVVHRDTILREALLTFKKVFKETATYGYFEGSKEDLKVDFLFSTNIMMNQHLSMFDPHSFDYIVIDECHHSVAATFKSIIEYFKSEFLLGLTATPERMDNIDVFELFDNNVPYELRLRDALINEIVVPFHYYGIRNIYMDYGEKNQSILARQLSSEANAERISLEINKHLPVGQKLKCIAFCKNIEHAKLLSESMELEGFNTRALLGTNSTTERMLSFKELQDENNPLQIIFSIDILNEGVDVPGINMILFLRPTESSTIFVQQLGRGLRKYPHKESLTVLDFIGNNYDRCVQVALALGGLAKNSVMEKQLLMDLVKNDFKSLEIPNLEIHMDQLTKEEILNHIEKTNFNQSKYLVQDYQNFKKYLHCATYPSHTDYLNNSCAPDLMRLMKSTLNGTKNKSYYSFLKKIGEERIPLFSDSQIEFIDIVSEMLPIVRLDEFLILTVILNGENDGREVLRINREYNLNYNEDTFEHALFVLEKLKRLIIRTDDTISLSIDSQDGEFKEFLSDLLNYGIKRYETEFGEAKSDFNLYSNYYKEQIMMNLRASSPLYMKGTKFFDDGRTIIFVGIKKGSVNEKQFNYKDKFLSPHIFQWESENKTTLTNSTGQKLLNSKVVYLFIRKMEQVDGITLPFTYFGTGHLTNPIPSKNGSFDTLVFEIQLSNPVAPYLFDDFKIPKEED